MQTRTIFFVGKPGSGKGTQARLLSQVTGWRVISAGDQFRAIAAEDTAVGRKVKLEMVSGSLSPHWFAIYLYLKALFSVSDEESVIFDGFNRKVQEADLVIDSLQWIERPFTVFDIRVSDEEVRRRLAKRKEIEGRADDSVVDERLEEYMQYTEPAIEIFRKRGRCVEINGEQAPEKIALDINASLKVK